MTKLQNPLSLQLQFDAWRSCLAQPPPLQAIELV